MQQGRPLDEGRTNPSMDLTLMFFQFQLHNIVAHLVGLDGFGQAADQQRALLQLLVRREHHASLMCRGALHPRDHMSARCLGSGAHS